MRVLVILSVVGQLWRVFSAAFLPPAALALFEGDGDAFVEFALAAVGTFALGELASRGSRAVPFLYRAEALAVVGTTWLTLAAFGSIPYLLEDLPFEDALFETMSGLTTTGATVFTDFSHYSRPLYLWRAMTQWFGGLGVIALFVVVLPQLGIAGRQLFFAEACPAASEGVSPHVRDNAKRLWMVYAGLTLLLIGLLAACGMGFYDAVVHALTTLAAGGFSPNAESIAGYANPMAEWVLTPFMILAGTSFVLQVRVFSGRPLAWVRDGEFLFYSGVAAVIALMVACVLAGGLPGETELRLGAFQVASLISSTGYASVDYERWPDGARALLIVAMVVGGCAGSAAGGPKAVRILMMIKRVATEIRRVLHPRAVLRIRYRGQPVEDDILRAITALVALFLTGYVLVGVALVVLGADLVTGFTASLACLGNIGPGFGVAGPMGNYADFSLGSKMVLIFAMWLGRLEIIPVLALLHPDAWRGTRLRA